MSRKSHVTVKQEVKREGQKRKIKLVDFSSDESEEEEIGMYFTPD